MPIHKPDHPQSLTPLVSATCPSLTGTSKISYKIALTPSSNKPNPTNLYFQIIKNSNNGKFSEEWIAYNDAKAALPIGSFSSAPLRTLYRNKSLNTPGFLLAALLNEGIVEREPGKVMLYRFKDDEKFLAEMEKLIAEKIDATDARQSAKSSDRKGKART